MSRQSSNVEVTCQTCGKKFLVWRCRQNAHPVKYCSRKCRSAKPKVICVGCGKEFETFRSEVKRGGGKYCSKECCFSETLEQRFWKYVDKRGPDECWIYTGTIHGTGYGVISDNKKSIKAHRYSLELHLGRPLLPGMLAIHSCDVRACVNPNHLREGTCQDNSNDMVSRKRQNTKLTEEQVIEIRRLKATGNYSQRELATMFGIDQSHINCIVNRKRWLHLTDQSTSPNQQDHQHQAS